MTPQQRSRRMFAATLAIFALVAFIAVDGDRRAFQGLDAVTVRREGADTLVFIWRGAVRAPMAQRFADAFAERGGEARRIVIELSSPGGSLAEGRAVIETVERMKRTHAVDTRVAPYDICLSMCVPIFLQGERRIAAPTSRFMFHEPVAYDAVTEARIERPAFERRMDSERFYRRYLEASDMNPEWGARLKAEWEGRDIWKTGRELVEEGSNIVTELR